jgi:predicted DNA-binding protein with PD1-like motif
LHHLLFGFCFPVCQAQETPMRSKLIQDHQGERTFAVIFDPGDEVLTGLQSFAREANLLGAHFTAIGAFRDVTLGFFDPERKEYRKTAVREQVEVLSLIGNVADSGGKPQVHAHVVVGKRDGTAHGGHLMEAHVRPTLEVIVVESPQHLHRYHDPATGLALIRV